MSVKVKLQVILAFSFRVPLVTLSALHLWATLNYFLPSSEPQLGVINSITAQQAMLIWSIISATIPNLRSFMAAFATGFGVPMGLGPPHQQPHAIYALQTIGGSSALESTGSRNPKTILQPRSHGISSHNQRNRLRPDEVHCETAVFFDSGSGTSGLMVDESYTPKNDSQELIIQKRIEWNISPRREILSMDVEREKKC